jgi:hypothetical protein
VHQIVEKGTSETAATVEKFDSVPWTPALLSPENRNIQSVAPGFSQGRDLRATHDRRLSHGSGEQCTTWKEVRRSTMYDRAHATRHLPSPPSIAFRQPSLRRVSSGIAIARFDHRKRLSRRHGDTEMVENDIGTSHDFSVSLCLCEKNDRTRRSTTRPGAFDAGNGGTAHRDRWKPLSAPWRYMRLRTRPVVFRRKRQDHA